jgi:hypothetical protein
MSQKAETIDITPTWVGILPTLLAVYSSAGSPEGRNAAYKELLRMAKIADDAVARQKGETK